MVNFDCSLGPLEFKYFWFQSIAIRFLFLVEFSAVTQSCPTLCDPVNCSTPGLPVHHQLPEFTQTHLHRVGDAIQPSHPLPSPSPPVPNPSQHQSLFQWVKSSHEVVKVWSFSFRWNSGTKLSPMNIQVERLYVLKADGSLRSLHFLIHNSEIQKLWKLQAFFFLNIHSRHKRLQN